MQNLRQVMRAFLIALASIGLLFGGVSLSLAEGGLKAPARFPTQTLPPTLSPTWQPFTTPADSPTPQLLPPTATLPPPPINCPPPVGWVAHIVQPGETLDSVAFDYHTTGTELGSANCLLANGLLPGVIIYVPPVPTATRIPCGRPNNWIPYIVQAGDTLYHISHNYAVPVTVAQLQLANCMGNSTWLNIGQTLFVPPWPTITPTITPTDTPTLTPTVTPTEPSPTASETPTVTPPTPSALPSETLTETTVPPSETLTETPETPTGP